MIDVRTIEIVETEDGIAAHIVDQRTGKRLDISLSRANYPDRNEMIADLFAGPLPNIRDCYDSDEWLQGN
jgi:hypothetical protein